MQFELDIASCPSLVQIVCLWPLGPPNAAPEWQAGSVGQSRELVEACPLEGLVSLSLLHRQHHLHPIHHHQHQSERVS
jgi:hypothetical protein